MLLSEIQPRLVRGYSSMSEIEIKRVVHPEPEPVPKKKRILTKWKQREDVIKKIAFRKLREKIVAAMPSFERRTTAHFIRKALDCIGQTAMNAHLKALRNAGTIRCDPPAEVPYAHNRLYWVDR